MRSQTLTIAGTEVEICSLGSGRPLLLIHDELGFNPDADYVRLLCAKRQLIAVSLPGFGSSELPNWIDTVDDISYILLSAMDQQGLRDVEVIGNSLGAWIAAEMLTKDPGVASAAVFCGPMGIKLGRSDELDFPDIFAMSDSDLREVLFYDETMGRLDINVPMEQLRATVRNRETFTLLGWEPYLHNPKLKQRLSRINCPALLMRGAQDRFTSAQYLAGFSSQIDRSSAIEIPESGHFIHLEKPAEFVATALTFFENRGNGR